jgi:hypothetical protein
MKKFLAVAVLVTGSCIYPRYALEVVVVAAVCLGCFVLDVSRG